MRIKEMAKSAQKYADLKQTKQLANELLAQIPQGKFTPHNAKGTKPVPHIRAQKISLDELKTAIANNLNPFFIFHSSP